MKTEEAFLADIIANPDDDAPRLIYADWLEEHGDEARAEFIRVQCEKARIVCWHDPERWDRLHDRELALFQEHQTAWQAELLKLGGRLAWEFERGFAGMVIVEDLATFRKHAAKVVRLAPVRKVRFLHLSAEDVAGLAEEPLLALFSRLDLSDLLLGDEGTVALMASPHLRQLKGLWLAHCGLGPAAAEAVAGTAALQGLLELDLSDNHILTRGARALVASPHLRGLRILHLYHIRIDYRSKTARELRTWLGKGLRW